MAIAEVQKTLNTTASAASLTATLNSVAAGNALILCIATSGAGTTISTVSDGTNTYARVVARQFAAGAGGLEIWNALNVSAGNFTVTVTPSGTVSIDVYFREISGLATSSAFDKNAGANGASASPDSGDTATLTQADEYVIGFLGRSASNAITEPAGYTNTSTNGFTNTASKIVAATTAVKYNPTLGGSETWNAMVATFKGAAAATVIPVFMAQYRQRWT